MRTGLSSTALAKNWSLTEWAMLLGHALEATLAKVFVSV